MLEQELASIMCFIADKAPVSPYYYEVPRNFVVPAVYYPIPEIVSGGETLAAYGVDYTWYIKFFHKSTQEAYGLGLSVLIAIKEERNLIPIVMEDGSKTENCWLRVKDPKLKKLDDGTVQLTICWRSRRPYKTTQDAPPSQSFHFDVFMKSGKEISEAYAETLERYAVPFNSSGSEPEQEGVK